MQSQAKKNQISHNYVASPLAIVLQATNHPCDDEAFSLLSDLGIDNDFAQSTEERTLGVVTRTGKPTFRAHLHEDPADRVLKVVLEHPIISYGMIEGNKGDFRLITIGCTERTHYVVVRGSVSFTFYIPRSSITIEEAVFELLTNNLIKGPRIYEKTAAIIADFFPKIMSAVHQDLTILRTTIRTADKLDLPCRIYFDPENHDDCRISVDGYVYGYDLNEYPKAQINRTLRVLEKQEKRDRRAAPRCVEHMNARERQQLAQRLEQTTLLATA
jgi:hypothetical protein